MEFPTTWAELLTLIRQVGDFFTEQPYLIEFAVLAAIGLGVAIALHALWSIARGDAIPTRRSIRLVASRLATAMREGRPVVPALAAARAEVPWMLAHRLGAAMASLTSAAPPSLAAALAERRVLPSPVATLAIAAERLGPDVLGSLLRALSREPLQRPRSGRRLTAALATLVGVVGMALFISVFIAPKFVAILRDIGLRYVPIDRLEELASSCWWYALAVAVLASVAIAVWSRWRWRAERRLLRGEIIAASLRARIPEADLAAALSLPATAPTVTALCRDAGWRVQDADELAIALERARERRDRLVLAAQVVAEMLAPLLVGIPVLLIAKTVFGMLVAIIVGIGGMEG
jgi:hypothetical protein